VTDDREKKLKELEESLAKELDQEVNLTKPSDARLSGNVDLNPNIKVEAGINVTGSASVEGAEKTKKETEPKSPDAKPAEVSLENLDDLLNDPSIPDTPKEEEAKNAEDKEKPAESFDPRSMDQEILQDLTKETRWERLKALIVEPLERILDPIARLWGRIYDFGSNYKETLFKVSQWGVPIAKNMFNYFRKTLPEIGSFFKNRVFSKFKNTWLWFKNLETQKKISVFGIFLILSVLILAGLNLDKLQERPPKLKNIRSFADVPGVKVITETQKQVLIEIADDEFEHVVRLQRLTANLKASMTSPRAMAVAEIFVVVSKEESAIEIRLRETEVRDFCTRLVESYTYEELKNPVGQEQLKEQIRSALNRVLNDGLVKKVYLKDLTIKN
jgi:flagellar basal body-associated protein FliL